MGTRLAVMCLVATILAAGAERTAFAAGDRPRHDTRVVAAAATATPGKYTISKKQGDYLIRNMKVWIRATNKKATSLNYKKATSHMGGTKFWRLKRRQATAYWYYVGKKLNHISSVEQKIIVDTYWPVPPSDCSSCVAAGDATGEPKSALMFELSGFVMTAAVARQILAESGGRVRPATETRDEPAQACTGTTKTVDLADKGYDAYYDSCDTDQMLRWLGYSLTACGAIVGSGALKNIVPAAKSAAEDRGLSLAAALLGTVCLVAATGGSESITDAQERSDLHAVMNRVRKMSYTPYPAPGHYWTDSRWVSQ